MCRTISAERDASRGEAVKKSLWTYLLTWVISGVNKIACASRMGWNVLDQDESPDCGAIAAPRLRCAERSQVDPDPRHLDDLIPVDHQARLIWELVGQLDLEPLYQRIKAVEGHPGRPPVDPKILVAVWCYATAEGISSARHLEKLCYIVCPITSSRLAGIFLSTCC